MPFFVCIGRVSGILLFLGDSSVEHSPVSLCVDQLRLLGLLNVDVLIRLLLLDLYTLYHLVQIHAVLLLSQRAVHLLQTEVIHKLLFDLVFERHGHLCILVAEVTVVDALYDTLHSVPVLTVAQPHLHFVPEFVEGHLRHS